jgi:hypothetical protein
MIPIGILTRNRAPYLHSALKRLTEHDVVVFDDASTYKDARRYLDTNETFKLRHKWPEYTEWNDLDLENSPEVTGIKDTHKVVKFEKQMGVVSASCKAITYLFEDNPGCEGVILLQDDVICFEGWYEKLTAKLDPQKKQGIIAGMHLDYCSPRRYYTAQCYLITRATYEALSAWMKQDIHPWRGFDFMICSQAMAFGLSMDIVKPYVCQHIGVKSLVRPDKQYRTDDYIRMGTPNNY